MLTYRLHHSSILISIFAPFHCSSITQFFFYSFDVPNLSWNCKAIIDRMFLTGLYKVTGKVLVAPIEGKGTFTANISKSTTSAEWIQMKWLFFCSWRRFKHVSKGEKRYKKGRGVRWAGEHHHKSANWQRCHWHQRLVWWKQWIRFEKSTLATCMFIYLFLSSQSHEWCHKRKHTRTVPGGEACYRKHNHENRGGDLV